MAAQRTQPVPIWGHVAPDESVSVRFAEQKKQAVADEQGNWTLALAPYALRGILWYPNLVDKLRNIHPQQKRPIA